MQKLLSLFSPAPAAESAPPAPAFAPELLICGINTPVCVQLLVNAPVFTLGKAEDCEGVLAFNAEISRRHCQIIWRAGEYFVRDLNSTNRTWLNERELAGGEEAPLWPGDRLQLSASTFVVEQIRIARGGQ